MKLKNLFKRNKCEHKYSFVTNIYGDNINKYNGARSIWRCDKCGKEKYSHELNMTLKEKLNDLYKRHYYNIYEQWKQDHKNQLDDLVTLMTNEAEMGHGSVEVMIVIDSATDDRWYYEKWFTEQDITVKSITTKDPYDVRIKSYMFGLAWN